MPPTSGRLVPTPGGAQGARQYALTLPAAQLAGRIQHALVGQGITESDVRRHVHETIEYGFDAAMVPAYWVALARAEMGAAGRVGGFVDYPYGTMTTAGRIAEVQALVRDGVDEIDLPINVGNVLSSRYSTVTDDLRAVVAAAAPVGVKVALELPLLTPEQQQRAVAAAVAAGVAFVQNATRGAVGIADGASTAFLRASVPASVGVKAAGGIKTIEQVREVLAAGADLVGSTCGVFIVTGDRRANGSLYSY